jgi:hypothetical protein
MRCSLSLAALLALAGTPAAAEVTVSVEKPMSPPAWALLQRASWRPAASPLPLAAHTSPRPPAATVPRPSREDWADVDGDGIKVGDGAANAAVDDKSKPALSKRYRLGRPCRQVRCAAHPTGDGDFESAFKIHEGADISINRRQFLGKGLFAGLVAAAPGTAVAASLIKAPAPAVDLRIKGWADEIHQQHTEAKGSPLI